MKINYFTFNSGNSKSVSLKQFMLGLVIMLSVSFSYAQSTLTVVTTSDSPNWEISVSNPIKFMDWTATGAVNQVINNSNTPVFNFSSNLANGNITVETTDTPGNFNGITELTADAGFGQQIISIDLTDLSKLRRLYLNDNMLTNIDLTQNGDLVQVELMRNDLTTLDLSQNNALEILNIDANLNLTSLDISNNPNLEVLSARDIGITTLDISNTTELIDIDLTNAPLTSSAIDYILNTLDGYGKSNGTLNLKNTTGGVITKNGIAAYISLIAKGWDIEPPQGFDLGDAPDSYSTLLTSGGAVHLFDAGRDQYVMGNSKDAESAGLPSVDADGDDADNLNDEDGVDPAEFNGIITSTTNVDIDVAVTNNLNATVYVHAWIDFDGSGAFDTDEYSTISVPANAGQGSYTLNWDILALGADILSGQTYARFRLTSDNDLTSSSFGGFATGGEVEDYAFVIDEDTDMDGVPDSADLDADNDGILNTDEVGDSNGNLIDDMLELDSDGDGCFDVTEAGFNDGDADGILGTSPVVVDANGLITDDALGPIADGFVTPNDLNNNTIYDFQEAGVAANITTQPTDQDLIIGDVTFTVVTDLAAGDESYQWEESTDGGTTWTPIVDAPGAYAGATTASLVVTNTDVSRLTDRYRIQVSNIAYACDPVTTSDEVTYITPEDFDGDLVFDIVDLDDDNDGILDTDEAGNTDPGTNEDRINLDSDGDGCFDVTEAGFTDGDADGQLGSAPISVDADGVVTSGSDGYTPPNDLNNNTIADFQEAGAAANITTQPTDQIYVLAGSSIFSVLTDLAVGDESYQWEESIDNGVTWTALTDGGDYTGANAADLTVSTPDFSKVNYRYRVLVNNVAYACDPVTTSTDVTFVTPGDFDKDGVFDVVDVDDDNDGILDVDEAGNTDPSSDPDATNLDSDGDGCFDVTEAGFTDVNGDGFLGNFPITVDANGQVTSGTDGYTPPNDLNVSGTPDFQEAGAAATITTQPADQDLIIGVTTFSVVATADTYQWQESTDGGATWAPLVDGGDYAGTTTADLEVTNGDVSKLTYRYRVLVNNIGYACDPTTLSAEARYIAPSDFDNDGVFDIVDVDDDNDGILDTAEPGNTDPATNPDALNLDADGDGCFDVTEAGFTDNGMGMLGTATPPVVDATGLVISATDGYTAPNDLDGNGTPDFQEAGAAAAITTQPADQNFIPGGTVTFDVVASADTYQWEESTDGSTWATVADGGNYSGATTASLTVSNIDISMLGYAYRVRVNNIAYACDPITTSAVAALVSLPDNDNDGVPDIVDVDDDNDGIFDTDEQDALGADIDSNNNGTPDRFELDSDSDGCDDVVEAGFTDGDGDGLLGNSPVTVNPTTGQVTSGTDGYTTPNDLDNNGTYDFQEAGAAANITGDPIDQDFVLGGSAIYTAASDGDTYQWEISTDGVSFSPLSDDAKYSGTATASLTVSGLVIPDYFNEYRVVASNVAFACDPGDASASASYNILLDTDNDGVFDIVDVDDDNDGIFDTVEGEVTDSNLDGRPDRISLDADGDGCADAIEAGFTDPDGDGIIGTSPVTVDADGQVTGQGGYTTPNDLDNNGVFDFQEAGEPSSIENQPEEIEIALGDDAIFEVSATATFYQWQQSMDGGSTWVDLANDIKFSGVTTDRLVISDARGRLEGSWYRVVLSSPDYACDPLLELESDGVRLVFNTQLIPSGFSPNGDGENDLFSIPGLIETPNFTMEVFDRWGNSVYQYRNNGNLNPEWWDGRSTGNMTLSKGQLVPAGTYFYLIEYNDGNKSPDKGWVYVNY